MYLDANFFIFATSIKEKRGEKARAITQEIIKGKKAITSSLALDEVMWVLVKNKIGHLMRPLIEEIYAIKNLEVKEVSSLTPIRALEFIETHKLKPRDAFHLAVMEQFGIREIVTDDKDFDNIPNVIRVKL